jgi:NADH-quinone oxidoreductase subunit M
MYDRLHTRQISDYGGLINRMPVFATLFMLFAMANCGLPGTSGFVGEFLVVMGSMKHSFWVAVAAASTLIWAAGYSLWLYKRVVFGAVGNARVETMADLNLREFIVLGLLAVAVLALGVYPDPFAAVLHTPVHDLLALVSQSKLPVQ